MNREVGDGLSAHPRLCGGPHAWALGRSPPREGSSRQQAGPGDRAPGLPLIHQCPRSERGYRLAAGETEGAVGALGYMDTSSCSGARVCVCVEQSRTTDTSSIPTCKSGQPVSNNRGLYGSRIAYLGPGPQSWGHLAWGRAECELGPRPPHRPAQLPAAWPPRKGPPTPPQEVRVPRNHTH